jgi:two-component sensor histidine kinase
MSNFIQKRVGVAVALCAFLLATVAFFNLIFIFNVNIARAIQYPAVWGVLLISMLMLLTGIFIHKLTRIIQITVFLATGYLAALDANWGNLTSAFFVAVGYLLAWEYGALNKRLTIKTICIGGLYIGTLFLRFVIREEAFDLRVIHMIIGIFLVFYLSLLVVRVQFERFKLREKKLEEVVEERTADIEKKLKENEKLRKEIESSLLEKTQWLEQRDVLIRELHHRTKNNMQLVSSLLELEHSGCEDQQIINIISKSQNRINALAIAHEHLYQAENIEMFDLNNYIPDLLHNLLQGWDYGNVHFHFTPSENEVFVPIATGIPVGIIVNELFTNAMKHGLRDNNPSIIEVALVLQDDMVEICLKDNGPGIPHSVDIEHPSSLGLQLVRLLSQQLHATVEVESDEGTEWIIRFPKQSSHI